MWCWLVAAALASLGGNAAAQDALAAAPQLVSVSLVHLPSRGPGAGSCQAPAPWSTIDCVRYSAYSACAIQYTLLPTLLNGRPHYSSHTTIEYNGVIDYDGSTFLYWDSDMWCIDDDEDPGNGVALAHVPSTAYSPPDGFPPDGTAGGAAAEAPSWARRHSWPHGAQTETQRLCYETNGLVCAHWIQHCDVDDDGGVHEDRYIHLTITAPLSAENCAAVPALTLTQRECAGSGSASCSVACAEIWASAAARCADPAAAFAFEAAAVARGVTATCAAAVTAVFAAAPATVTVSGSCAHEGGGLNGIYALQEALLDGKPYWESSTGRFLYWSAGRVANGSWYIDDDDTVDDYYSAYIDSAAIAPPSGGWIERCSDGGPPACVRDQFLALESGEETGALLCGGLLERDSCSDDENANIDAAIASMCGGDGGDGGGNWVDSSLTVTLSPPPAAVQSAPVSIRTDRTLTGPQLAAATDRTGVGIGSDQAVYVDRTWFSTVTFRDGTYAALGFFGDITLPPPWDFGDTTDDPAYCQTEFWAVPDGWSV